MSKMKHKETRIKWKNADFYLLYTIAFAGIALFLYMRFLPEWEISDMES